VTNCDWVEIVVLSLQLLVLSWANARLRTVVSGVVSMV